MSETNTTIKTPANVIAMPVTAAKAKVPKQWMLGCFKDDKEKITAIASEYVGPGVTKEYGMTEKEVVNMLLHVAKNRRFETTYPVDEDGEYIYDEVTNEETGEVTRQVRYETVDHFDLESKRIFALRETAATKAVNNNDPAVLRATMAKIQAKIDALEAASAARTTGFARP